MQTQTYNRKSDAAIDDILIVGDTAKVFTDNFEAIEHRVCVCSKMLDAIDIISQKDFSAICIVAADFGTRLKAALKALREVSVSAKIVLLVEMYEEPFAIELMSDEKCVDDYIIAPFSTRQFLSMLLPSDTMHPQKQQPAQQPIFEQNADMIEQLTKLATEDDLTGLKNRRYMREFLRQIIERAKQEEIRITLLLFDIDNFKYYNDVYGHAAGDEILREAAVLMKQCCRKHDVVGRIGGDEFAAVFWDNPKGKHTNDERRTAQAEHPKEIFFVAERFRQSLNSAQLPALGHDGQGVLTISGGLAGFPRDGQTVDDLFAQADAGLLEVKRSGKNRVYLIGEPKSS